VFLLKGIRVIRVEEGKSDIQLHRHNL